ncbi:uncharacterized protein BO97DRAFT_428347 [Aspergillus homomorphus CBS 101889]|uniref:Uncharacterized protein n=1 Tax=Aspergillus homomorphus (strain CBS 101889) TaxID=1450537 RepID=A0A395HKP8_ASPHC|nr:hypothetical protein BO97DRAFT_428347 [Aspergillus homomorphus CBS 101889]RAL08522.1 hypothetical protein BO97DRAFT_428347 [Aspergillus homomorphus CBS 101889]
MIAKNSSKSADSASQIVEQPAQGPITGRVLRFFRDQPQELKLSATAPSAKGWVSTFEFLTTYLYQAMYRARVQLLRPQGVPSSQAADRISRGIFASIDMRGPSRLKLLEDGALWAVTKTLHDLIRAPDAQQMKQTTSIRLSTEEDLMSTVEDGGKPTADDVNLTLSASLWPALDADEENRKTLPESRGPPLRTRIADMPHLVAFFGALHRLRRCVGASLRANTSSDPDYRARPEPFSQLEAIPSTYAPVIQLLHSTSRGDIEAPQYQTGQSHPDDDPDSLTPVSDAPVGSLGNV